MPKSVMELVNNIDESERDQIMGVVDEVLNPTMYRDGSQRIESGITTLFSRHSTTFDPERHRFDLFHASYRVAMANKAKEIRNKIETRLDIIIHSADNVGFFNRSWSDLEKWLMGLVAVFIVAILTYIVDKTTFTTGDVIALASSKIDSNGRCYNDEIFIENKTEKTAKNIKIYFDVDYISRRDADITLDYGDEKQMLIPPGVTRSIERREYYPVENSFDSELYVLNVPKMEPSSYIHLYYGGEFYSGASESAMRARDKMISLGDIRFMNKPRAISAVRDDGKVTLRQTGHCMPN